MLEMRAVFLERESGRGGESEGFCFALNREIRDDELGCWIIIGPECNQHCEKENPMQVKRGSPHTILYVEEYVTFSGILVTWSYQPIE